MRGWKVCRRSGRGSLLLDQHEVILKKRVANGGSSQVDSQGVVASFVPNQLIDRRGQHPARRVTPGFIKCGGQLRSELGEHKRSEMLDVLSRGRERLPPRKRAGSLLVSPGGPDVTHGPPKRSTN